MHLWQLSASFLSRSWPLTRRGRRRTPARWVLPPRPRCVPAVHTHLRTVSSHLPHTGGARRALGVVVDEFGLNRVSGAGAGFIFHHGLKKPRDESRLLGYLVEIVWGGGCQEC
jgi:hypothetical protein